MVIMRAYGQYIQAMQSRTLNYVLLCLYLDRLTSHRTRCSSLTLRPLVQVTSQESTGQDPTFMSAL